jgi:diguanylate cyclase (GGDEF)-like protein
MTKIAGASIRADANEYVADVLDRIPGCAYQIVLTRKGSFQLTYLSPSAAQFIGEAAAKGDFEVFLTHVHSDDLADFLSELKRSADSLTPSRTEFRLFSPTGEVRWFRNEAAPRRGSDGDVVWAGLALDVTAEKLAQRERDLVVAHDPLTGLPNRDVFRARLLDAVEAIDLNERIVGLFLVDLDAFTDLNCYWGAAVGDQVLSEVGERLVVLAQACFGTVARLGGDEFAVLLPGAPDLADAHDFAQSLCDAIAAPVMAGDDLVSVRGSLGYTLLPHPAGAGATGLTDVFAELMKQADMALRSIKRDDPGKPRLYSRQLDDRFRHRTALRESLSEALTNGQLDLHYKPVVSLRSGLMAGAEALLRWNHPALGLQGPDSFIPLAEAAGLIAPIGEWMLTEVFKQGEAWRAAGQKVGRIGIDLYSAQIRPGPQRRAPDFLAVVERALAQTGADPLGYEFELPETLLIEMAEEETSTLSALKSRGFNITIDHFGSGHASFGYLRNMSVDRVKIDPSFIRRIGEDRENDALVRSMIRLCRLLGAQVVAAGVETREQRDFLLEEGCVLGQGSLFSMPVKAEDFGWLLRQDHTLLRAA